MIPHTPSFRLMLAVLLAANPVFAQELGLDLSDSTDQAPAPYRPIIAIIGAVSSEPAADTVTANRAKLVELELVRLAKLNEAFQSVVAPPALASKLGADAPAALKCADWQCMEKLAKQAGVNRLIMATVAKAGVGSVVSIRAWDSSATELLSVSQDSGEKTERTFAGVGGKTQAQKDREFLKKVAGFMVGTLAKLTTANGKLIIDNPEPTAVVNLDGVDVGTGSLELFVSRGAHTVAVKTEAYLPFEQSVTLEPGKDASVKVSLVAKPLDVAKLAVVKDTGPSIITKPGLYVAIAGAAALIAGVLLGQMAKGVEAKAQNPGPSGVVPITRAQAKSAQSQAMLANVLGGVGAAAVAGGTVWLIVSAGGGKKSGPGGSSEPTDLSTFVGVGGTF